MQKNPNFVKNFYAKTLQKHKEQNLYRKLIESDVITDVKIKRGKKNLLNFSSNCYFGLSQNLQVKKAAIAAIKKYGVGAGASRYVSGNNSLYTKLEKQLARIKNCDDAIVFSSGYATAIGVIPALVGEGDLIVADRLIHASLIDGAKLSGARLMRFQHNDVAHAREILCENRAKFKKCLIITETVFSMDGDLGAVADLQKLATEFDALLVADDAHGLFVSSFCHPDFLLCHPDFLLCHPERSEGSHEFNLQDQTHEILRCAQDDKGGSQDDRGERQHDDSKGNQDNRLIILGTLSKAVGTVGGYVAGEKNMIDFLRNFARSQIYSTALPPVVLEAAITSLQIIKKKNPAQKTLQNAEYFCHLMHLEKPQSAIIPLIIGDAQKTLDIAKTLEQKGFLVGAIRYPTVEKNKARLRITFSSQHKKSDIKKLAEALQNFQPAG